MLGRQRGWVKVTGNVVARDERAAPTAGGYGGMSVVAYVIDVRPDGEPPFRAEVGPGRDGHFLGMSVEAPSFRQPREGDTVALEYNPKTHEVRFDMDDASNHEPKGDQAAVDDRARFEEALHGAVGSPPPPAGGAREDTSKRSGLLGSAKEAAEYLQAGAQLMVPGSGTVPGGGLPGQDRDLLAHGAEGHGVVVSEKTLAFGQFSGEKAYKIEVRFRFADGSETTITCSPLQNDTFGSLRVGDKVPVRYDPENHARVTVDVPALRDRHREDLAEEKDRQQRLKDEKVARAQAEIEGREWHPPRERDTSGDTTTHRPQNPPARAKRPRSETGVSAVPPDLAANGILGRAALLGMSNGSATVKVRLIDGTPPYTATCRLARDQALGLMPGQSVVAVRVDPNDHSRLAISPDESTPVVTITDTDVIEPPARALREGEACRVVVLASKRQWLKTPDGDEIYQLKLRVTSDGTELTPLVPVPRHARALLNSGAELPGKRVPAEPKVITVDWAAATPGT
jgi:hypothetical protein